MPWSFFSTKELNNSPAHVFEQLVSIPVAITKGPPHHPERLPGLSKPRICVIRTWVHNGQTILRLARGKRDCGA